ncbi:hypothetical protein D3C76_1275780 [compost metagenome]
MRQAHTQAVTDQSQCEGRRAAQQLQHGENDPQFSRLQGQGMPQTLQKRPQPDLPGTKQKKACQRGIGGGWAAEA